MANINYINANILISTDHLWAHGCNAQGKFASGVAGILRKSYPYSYKTYIDHYTNQGLMLGDVIFSEEENDQPIIANCITQQNYGYDGKRYVDYQAIDTCMETLMLFSKKRAISALTMSKIGAGLGGGDWNLIEQIISTNVEKINPSLLVNVYWL